MTDLPFEVTPRQAREMLSRASEPPLLLDCRRPDEHAAARIAGALLVPMDQIAQRLGELDEHAERDVIVHCHHGVRSLQVVAFLRKHGFERAVSMAGGIDRWSLEIDQAVPRY
jgi:rhodanese-related sulfurtransferase